MRAHLFHQPRSLAFIGAVMILISIAAQATSLLQFDPRNSRCFEFKVEQTAAAADMVNVTPNATTTNESTPLEKQIWCYHRGVTEGDPLFVYNADQSEIKPELSFIVDAEGVLTHASLLNGNLTYHKVQSLDYNPFPVPLREPTIRSLVEHPEIHKAWAEKVLNQLASHQQDVTEIFSLKKHFDFSSSEFPSQTKTITAQASQLPWRGFWWGYKNQPLSRNSESPLGKYERYLYAHTGQKLNARGWENSHHRYKKVWWEGHCNGWAASSILRPEPRFARFDMLSGITFTVADQKGILAETDYCAAATFYGRRNRGRASDDIRDIYPAVFHKTLLYHIGSLHKPIVVDYRQDTAVDNHPVSGYIMELTQTEAQRIQVKATLFFHKYDGKRNFPPGVAPVYTRIYQYTLLTDAAGNITGGFWRSKNPDFIWVPLSSKDCDSNNPAILHDQVNQILSLPAAPENVSFWEWNPSGH